MILAAYLKCFAQKELHTDDECHSSLLLTSATIVACGGFHFITGENDGVLPDPYYVNYAEISKRHKKDIKNYYDFIVMYGVITSYSIHYTKLYERGRPSCEYIYFSTVSAVLNLPFNSRI